MVAQVDFWPEKNGEDPQDKISIIK